MRVESVLIDELRCPLMSRPERGVGYYQSEARLKVGVGTDDAFDDLADST